VEFIGWSVFSTGLNGEYRGNYLGAQAYIEQLLGISGITSFSRSGIKPNKRINPSRAFLRLYHSFRSVFHS